MVSSSFPSDVTGKEDEGNGRLILFPSDITGKKDERMLQWQINIISLLCDRERG